MTSSTSAEVEARIIRIEFERATRRIVEEIERGQRWTARYLSLLQRIVTLLKECNQLEAEPSIVARDAQRNECMQTIQVIFGEIQELPP